MPRAGSPHAWVRILRSLAGLLWFTLWFFLVFPGLVLVTSGAGLAPAPGTARALGIGLGCAAYAAAIGESLRFALRGRGTPMPFDPPRELVAEGPYRRVRNPMYLLYVLVVIAEAIAFRSAWLAGYAAALFGVAHLYVVKHEEPRLRARFGTAYADYCQRVPRWLPRRSLPLDVRMSDSTTRNSRGTL